MRSGIHFLLAIASLGISAALWMLGLSLIPAGGRGAYAVLEYSAAIPDREIRERLENQGFSGLVCESGQWAFLDSFDGITQIPLDQYDGRVLSFDPRNDGYAEKLRSLFVRDDKRRIYIPLGSPIPVKAAGVEARLAVALGDIPYGYFEQGKGQRRLGAGVLLGIFMLAAGALAIIAPLRRDMQPYAACLLPGLPVLAPLALAGAAGFALISVLAGFMVLLAGFALQRFARSPNPLLPKILPVFLLAGYGILARYCGVPFVFAFLVLVMACSILAAALWAASRTERTWEDIVLPRRVFRRPRFAPVAILKRRSSFTVFSGAMLPFAAASLVLAIAGLAAFWAAPAVSPLLPDAGTLSEADYLSHYRFQSGFSLTALHSKPVSGPVSAAEVRDYELAGDGLLGYVAAHADAAAPMGADYTALPVFPLADFLRYLDSGPADVGTAYSLLAALLPPLFIIPVIIRRRYLINRAYFGIL